MTEEEYGKRLEIFNQKKMELDRKFEEQTAKEIEFDKKIETFRKKKEQYFEDLEKFALNPCYHQQVRNLWNFLLNFAHFNKFVIITICFQGLVS